MRRPATAMVERRPGSRDCSGPDARRRGRGAIMVKLILPRFVINKQLASGKTGFYFNIHKHWRKLGCTIPNEPLGTDYIDACGKDGNGGRAAALNALFDEWDATRRGMPIETGAVKIGSVDWL